MKKRMSKIFAIAMAMAVTIGCAAPSSGDNGTSSSEASTQASETSGQTQVSETTSAQDISPRSTWDEATDSAMVTVEQGTYLGTKENGIYRFVGMQYGIAQRFQMPEKAPAFEGIHTATTYGNSCPTGADSVAVTSYMTPNGYYAENEDCLYLNVWSPSIDENSADKAVVVFIHGGGFSSGSSNELTYYDGANFAKREDVVFVSINTRLNVLGYTDLSAYGEEYKYSGNAGQADIVLALEWVRDNISKFGGDADNVTLLGQSGGGSKVTSILTMPAAEGLFNKAIICSGGGAITQTSEESSAAGQALVEKAKETYGLSTDEEALELLTTMDYDDLNALSADTGVGSGPTVDGDYIVESPIDPETKAWSEMASDIPVIISFTFAEMSGNMANLCLPAMVNNSTPFMEDPVDTYLSTCNKNYMTDEDKQAALEAKFGENTEAITQAFLEAYPDKEAFDATRLATRTNDLATGKASSGEADVYQCVFAWEFPIFGGTPAWHTGGDLPFIFQNLEDIENMIAGDDATAYKIADEASDAFGNFIKTGNPSTDTLEWSPFTIENGETMIFDTTSEVRNYHDRAVQELLSQLPAANPFG